VLPLCAAVAQNYICRTFSFSSVQFAAFCFSVAANTHREADNLRLLELIEDAHLSRCLLGLQLPHLVLYQRLCNIITTHTVNDPATKLSPHNVVHLEIQTKWS